MKQIRQRLTYANVMSSIAVFLVVGGATAFAALGKNTVGSKQLKKNAVTAAKIKKNAVANAKIADNAVTNSKVSDGAVTNTKIADNSVNGAKVIDHSLTGADIDSGTLGTVPKATSADTAKTADSAKVAGTVFSENSGTSILPFNAVANVQTTVITLDVPAGNYLVWGKVLGNNNSAASVLGNCQLEAGGTVIDNGFDSFRLGPEAEGDRAYVPMGGVAALPGGGTLAIKCKIASTEGNWLNRVLTATQVATIG